MTAVVLFLLIALGISAATTFVVGWSARLSRGVAQVVEDDLRSELARSEREYDALRAGATETIRVLYQAHRADSVTALRPAMANAMETLRRACGLDTETLGELLADVPTVKRARRFASGPPSQGLADPGTRPT